LMILINLVSLTIFRIPAVNPVTIPAELTIISVH
jgi:hypothetical protein